MSAPVISQQEQEFGVGRCVYAGEHNGYDDSDFYGIFAVPVEGGGFRFEKKIVGSTRHAGGYIPRADATDEVKAAYQVARDAALVRLEADHQDELARVPDKGDAVTIVEPVTRGKNKVAAGEVGVVFWRGGNRYGDQYGAKYGRPERFRVGVELFDGDKVFLSEDKVRVQGRETEALGSTDRTVDYLVAGSWPAIH